MQYASIFRENICQEVGNTEVIAVQCQLPVCFVTVPSYLMSQFAVLCLALYTKLPRDMKNSFRGSVMERKKVGNRCPMGRTIQTHRIN